MFCIALTILPIKKGLIGQKKKEKKVKKKLQNNKNRLD